jgi:hypothetical protein
VPARRLQHEKLGVEEENRTLRDSNFELQAKSRADQAAAKRLQQEALDKDKQLKVMTDQNAELLRLLETEEAQTARLDGDNRQLKEELEALRSKYASLLQSAKMHEELAAQAARCVAQAGARRRFVDCVCVWGGRVLIPAWRRCVRGRGGCVCGGERERVYFCVCRVTPPPPLLQRGPASCRGAAAAPR